MLAVPSNELRTERRILQPHREQVDTLVVTDVMAANLMLEGTTVITLHGQEGFKELGQNKVRKSLKVSGFKLVVLLCGRPDLYEPERDFRQGLAFCLNAIREGNPKAIVLLTATLPSPRDSRAVIHTANY